MEGIIENSLLLEIITPSNTKQYVCFSPKKNQQSCLDLPLKTLITSKRMAAPRVKTQRFNAFKKRYIRASNVIR